MADEERVMKIEHDYSADVDVKLPEAEGLAKAGRVPEAIEFLLPLEKQARTASDFHSTARILVAILRMCYAAKNYKLLNEQIIFLSKRRGQLKQAVQKMVQEACLYVEEISDLPIKMELIDTLRTVTAGKIHVENERARLTMTLAYIKEGQNKIAEAAEILQELQVETFGSMDRREKVDFILEQMRLCLAKRDLVRTQIISKKISSRFFENSENQDLKLKYLRLMIQLGEEEFSYLPTFKYYKSIFETPSVLESEPQWTEALKSAVLFAVLAPYDNEQSDLLHRLKEEKKLAQLPVYKELLTMFLTAEIMRWSKLEAAYGQELRSTKVFGAGDAGARHWTDLRKRVVEHNIRVIAKYYTKITSKRLCQLLDLPEDEAELYLSDLVSAKTVHAKIDRPAGVIVFVERREPRELLNEWASGLNTLMALVDKTTHLITKEEMVHKITEVKTGSRH
eukprot:Opistho-2@65131